MSSNTVNTVAVESITATNEQTMDSLFPFNRPDSPQNIRNKQIAYFDPKNAPEGRI
jgi:hypothetical protein